MEETKGTKSTRELFMETLTEIGCQYELSEDQDDDRIFFDYQGEHFLAGVNNDSFYVHIYDQTAPISSERFILKYAAMSSISSSSGMEKPCSQLATVPRMSPKISSSAASLRFLDNRNSLTFSANIKPRRLFNARFFQEAGEDQARL